MKNLRKVKYHLDAGFMEYVPDLTHEEKTKKIQNDHERDGFFHVWTTDYEPSKIGGDDYLTSKAIIEDAVSGKLVVLTPNLFHFVPDEK